MTTLQPRLEVTVDDEHPWFEAIMARQRAQRNPTTVKAVVAPPAPLELTVTVDGVAAQRYSLEHVAAMEWSDARAKMRTNWVPQGNPVDLNPEETITATDRSKTK